MKNIIVVIVVSVLCLTACVDSHESENISNHAPDLLNQPEDQEAKPDTSSLEGDNAHEGEEDNDNQEEMDIIQPEGMTILDRFHVPKDFTRITVKEDSFGAYLRKLPLKEHGSKVLYHDGRTKNVLGIYEAVVDMDIGERNLQQCADAVMRLRGEYLYGMGAYNKIHFNFTNGFRVDYSKWMDGYRVRIEGNKTSYTKSHAASNTYEDFRRYMNLVFVYAGTLSLEQELESVDMTEMAIGDVLIQGGNPGHTVIVVDMATNDEGKQLYMLAQSYMPAQDIQILCNPNSEHSPWYPIEESEQIITPEWTFSKEDLKRFTED